MAPCLIGEVRNIGENTDASLLPITYAHNMDANLETKPISRRYLTGLSGCRAVAVAALLFVGQIFSGWATPHASAAKPQIAPVKLNANQMNAMCAYAEGKASGTPATGYRCEFSAFAKTKPKTPLTMVCTAKRDCSVQFSNGSAFPEPYLVGIMPLILFVVPPTEFSTFCKKKSGKLIDTGSGYLKCTYKAGAVSYTAYRDNDATVVFSDAGILTPKAAHDLFGRKI